MPVNNNALTDGGDVKFLQFGKAGADKILNEKNARAMLAYRSHLPDRGGGSEYLY